MTKKTKTKAKAKAKPNGPPAGAKLPQADATSERGSSSPQSDTQSPQIDSASPKADPQSSGPQQDIPPDHGDKLQPAKDDPRPVTPRPPPLTPKDMRQHLGSSSQSPAFRPPSSYAALQETPPGSANSTGSYKVIADRHENQGYDRLPGDIYLDRVGVLRTMLHILRGVDSLSAGKPQEVLKHFEAAATRAHLIECWPLLQLCEEFKGLTLSRRTHPDTDVIKTCETKAQKYARKTAKDAQDRWTWLTPKVDDLRMRSLYTARAGTRGRALTVSFEGLSGGGALASRRGRHGPKPINLTDERPEIARGLDSGVSIQSRVDAPNSGESLTAIANALERASSNSQESGSARGVSGSQPGSATGNQPPKTPRTPGGSKSPYVAPPNSVFRRYSKASSSHSDSPRSGGSEVPALPARERPKSSHGPPPKLPMSPRISSPLASGQSSSVETPNGPNSPGAGKTHRRKGSAHFQQYKLPGDSQVGESPSS